jgi:low affinity Fe/Cu permease
VSDWFHKVATAVAKASGHWLAFIGSLAIVIAWALTGPIFQFSETWQLVINTGTTIITFWMVFLVQHTANSENAALHAKVDELIRAIEDANNNLIGIEKE